MKVTLDQIVVEARRLYGSQGAKITKTHENVYVDYGAFYLVLCEADRKYAVRLAIGWEVDCDSVSTEFVYCELDAVALTVNKLCYALIDQITMFIQEAPNEAT